MLPSPVASKHFSAMYKGVGMEQTLPICYNVFTFKSVLELQVIYFDLNIWGVTGYLWFTAFDFGGKKWSIFSALFLI